MAFKGFAKISMALRELAQGIQQRRRVHIQSSWIAGFTFRVHGLRPFARDLAVLCMRLKRDLKGCDCECLTGVVRDWPRAVASHFTDLAVI